MRIAGSPRSRPRVQPRRPETAGRNQDGAVSRAELFLVEAQQLAVVPAEVLGCEAVDDEVACSTADSAPFYRVQGIDVGPFEVTIGEGLITEIHLPTPGTHGHVGSCANCRGVSNGVYEYHLWLALIPPGAVCRAGLEDVPIEGSWTEQLGPEEEHRNSLRNDPLSIWPISGDGAGSAFSDRPWIKPVASERHRELIPEWLAWREPFGTAADASWVAVDTTFGETLPAYGFTDVERSELVSSLHRRTGVSGCPPTVRTGPERRAAQSRLRLRSAASARPPEALFIYCQALAHGSPPTALSGSHWRSTHLHAQTS